ncbi:MAG: NUDIX hydrolase [Mollicutes bacterium]|jgi:ADP-ribose pyrophosphatase|nr:NUDIX hydrolase [Mollicutes bacterium]
MLKEKLQELNELISMYKTIASTKPQIVNGNFIKVGSAEYILANGKTIKREEIIKNGGRSSASIILPITENKEIILIVQPRVFTKLGVGVELPAGYIDAYETGKMAALRELKEETGYVPKKIIKVGEYYQDQGCSRALNECFVAFGCQKQKKRNLDDDEFISEFLCNYDELLELMDMNYICDAGSIITIEKAKKYLKKL